MLKELRQPGVKSAVYLIIFATIIIFIVQFRPGAQGQSGSIRQECVAEIRGRCIDPKEYRAELMLLAPGRIIDPSELRMLGVRKAVLDGLVERTLLVQDAKRLGLTVAEADLDKELMAGRFRVSLPVERARMMAYRLRMSDDGMRVFPVTTAESKQFDYPTYERVVRSYSGRSPTEFKVMQREELLASRMRELVRGRVRVGDDEAFTTYQREKSTATIRFATFRRGWFARHALDLSPSAIDAWAAAHKEEVDRVFENRKSQYLPECRTARHILVKIPEGATDEQKAEARAKIEAALLRVQKGEDFATVAREESDDTSAADGGYLECFRGGRMVKPFEDAVQALKPGEISQVVESQFGFHVIKLEGVHKDADAEAVGRRETAKTLMVSTEAETLAAETAKKVLAAVKSGTKFDTALAESLAAIKLPAGAKGRKAGVSDDARTKKGAAESSDQVADVSESDRPHVEISAPFNGAGDPVTGVAPGQSVAQMAFKLEKEGDAPSELVKLQDGYAVIQLKEKNAASREQFESERDTFIAAMVAAKQSDALNGYAMRLRDSARTEIKVNEAYAKASEKEKPSEGEEE